MGLHATDPPSSRAHSAFRWTQWRTARSHHYARINLSRLTLDKPHFQVVRQKKAKQPSTLRGVRHSEEIGLPMKDSNLPPPFKLEHLL